MSALSSPASSRIPRSLLVAVAFAAALLLVWRILAAGVAALDERDGRTETRDRADAESPERQLRARLARNPADFAALVVLGLHLEQQGRKAEAQDAMREAQRLAPANERALFEIAAFQLRAGEETQALTVLRRAVELNPTAAGATWPVFTAALDSGQRDEFFARAARDDPWWWAGFFNQACQGARSVDALQRVFGVRAASGKVTAGERRCLIERLERENRWPQAYQSWINSLPKDRQQRIAYIYNGDFEVPISNLGFDWLLLPQDGINVDAQSIQGAEGRRALRVEFVRKRWSGTPVQQYLMLPPGKYRFEGRGRADGLDTWVGVQWRLSCFQNERGATQHLSQSERFRGTSEWVVFRDDFTVPRDCPVQILRLELANPRADVATPDNVVTRLNGNVWFDDFRVTSTD